jgi:hypothetical protein
MSGRKPPSACTRRDAYQEVTYRESLRTLGLFGPVALEDIHQAYRARAKMYHPDRLARNGNAEEATRRIQKLNAAHEYVVRHYPAFEKGSGRGRRRAAARRGDNAAAADPWLEFLLAPVTILYSLALLVAALPAIMFVAPFQALARHIGGESGVVARWVRAVRERWLAVGPHLAVLGAFLALERWQMGATWTRWWLGISLLVMVSAELASRMTGESNPLRTHRAVDRLHAFVRGY